MATDLRCCSREQLMHFIQISTQTHRDTITILLSIKFVDGIVPDHRCEPCIYPIPNIALSPSSLAEIKFNSNLSPEACLLF